MMPMAGIAAVRVIGFAGRPRWASVQAALAVSMAFTTTSVSRVSLIWNSLPVST